MNVLGRPEVGLVRHTDSFHGDKTKCCTNDDAQPEEIGYYPM